MMERSVGSSGYQPSRGPGVDGFRSPHHQNYQERAV